MNTQIDHIIFPFMTHHRFRLVLIMLLDVLCLEHIHDDVFFRSFRAWEAALPRICAKHVKADVSINPGLLIKRACACYIPPS